MRRGPLPLGVDIGATRVRVVEAERTPQGPRIRAAATRDISPGASSGALRDPDYVGTLVEEAVRELGTKTRVCVCAIGEPDALLRAVDFPRMTHTERQTSGQFEAQRYVDAPINATIVRIHPAGQTWALGVARPAAVHTRVEALRKARLRPLAVDHESCALSRALPGFDAILDAGFERTSLHVVTQAVPSTLQIANGGASVTRAIERELSIDERTAEKRKRILGTAGAGERARAALAADIGAMISEARAYSQVSRVALVGNGARLPGLIGDLEAATGAFFELPVSAVLQSPRYPEDVLRSSAPDWTLAAGLTSWCRP